MNTFIIRNKLKQIRKSGTYSRLLQKHKKQIIPSSQKHPGQISHLEKQDDLSSSGLPSSIPEIFNAVSESNVRNTSLNTEDSEEIVEDIVVIDNCQGIYNFTHYLMMKNFYIAFYYICRFTIFRNQELGFPISNITSSFEIVSWCT